MLSRTEGAPKPTHGMSGETLYLAVFAVVALIATQVFQRYILRGLCRISPKGTDTDRMRVYSQLWHFDGISIICYHFYVPVRYF